MCDFHSVCIRRDGAIAHVRKNSHSEAVKSAGWRENEPNREPNFYEWEWDGEGDVPEPITRIVRGCTENMPDEVLTAARKHATGLKNCLKSGTLIGVFTGPEYADVARQCLATKISDRRARSIAQGILNALPEDKSDSLTKEWLALSPRDYSRVADQFLFWLVSDPEGLLEHANEPTKKTAKKIADAYERKLQGEIVPREEWKTLSDEAWANRNAAYAAAAYAAATYAAATYDAAAAAAYDAAAYAAAYAAAAATYDAAARLKARIRHAEKFTELFREAA